MNIVKPSSSFLSVLEGHRQWPSLLAICDRLVDAGFDAVLAGGCVRDALLNVVPKDFDIATSATPDQVEALFEKTVAVGKSFGVIVVLTKGDSNDDFSVEIATYREDGSYTDGRRPEGVVFSDRKEDSNRRDFTVNALFYDPIKKEIIDYHHGLTDLDNRCLKTVGDPLRRFHEDKLRLLRAVRFVGQLGFVLEEKTRDAIRKNARELRLVSRERIRDEIDKLLKSPFPQNGFDELDRLGLAQPVFEDWAPFVLPPHPLMFQSMFQTASIEIRRLVFYYPAVKRLAADRIQERLRMWKYPRAFVEQVVWMVLNEAKLRATSADPVRRMESREEIIARFEPSTITGEDLSEERNHTLDERTWMTALQLWTDARAPHVCGALDLLKGADEAREKALAMRGLELGVPDPNQAKAEDILRKPEGAKLEGPKIGRELRRLNREILLRKS